MMISYNSQFIDNSDKSYVSKVLKNKKITQGPIVEKFEKNISNFVKSKYCLVTNSGTSALYLAIKSLNLKKNSVVIMPAVNFIAAFNVCKILELNIFLSDVNPITGLMEPKNFNDCVRKYNLKKINLIINMHMGGNPNNVQFFYKIKKKFKSYLIEDSCHALGSEYFSKKKYYKIGDCNHADISTFSFHAIKSITTGEGGAITTNNKFFFNNIIDIRSHGIKRHSNDHWKYDVLFPSFNFRISDINCALGISQLKKIRLFLKKRNKIAKVYHSKLSTLSNYIKLIKIDNKSKSSYHLFQISINFQKLKTKKDNFINFMKKKNIILQYHYIPIYKFSIFKEKLSLPGAEEHFQNNISLPIHYKMSMRDVDYVIQTIKLFIFKNKSTKL